jgi:hypothetical protein
MIETILSLPLYLTTPVVLIGYSMVCLGTGIVFFKLLAGKADCLSRTSALTILATKFILGQGLLASLWLLLALAGWFSIEVVGIICFFFAALGLYFGRDLFHHLRIQVTSIWHELRQETWVWQLIAGLTIVLWLFWWSSLGRPLLGDGATFYMPLAKIIAYSHRLVPLFGWEEFTSIGLQGELHFAALMSLHSPDAAKLFSWPTITMAAIMLAALGRAAGLGRRGQWLALGILFSSSAVIWLSGDGKVDLFGAALGMAAYYWAVQIRKSHSWMTLLLTGLFSGFSIVAKMSYMTVMPLTIALLVVWGYEYEWRNKAQWRSGLASLASGCLIVFAGVLLASLPHFVKNGLLFHNSFAPLGFGELSWLKQIWHGPETTRRIALSYPLAITYGSYWAQYGNMSPLMLAFLPLAFCLPRPRSFFSSSLVVLTLLGLIGLVLWIISNPSIVAPRYILALLSLLILLPARAAEYVSLNEQQPRLLAVWVPAFTIVVLVAVGLLFWRDVFVPDRTAQYLTGAMGECGRDGKNCGAMNKINRKADLGDRVYLATFHRYWLRGDLLQCTLNRRDRTATPAVGEQFWLDFYQDGYEFLLLDRDTYAFIVPHLDLEDLPNWVHVTLIEQIDPLYTYQVEFDPVPSTIERTSCQRLGSSTIWEVVYP